MNKYLATRTYARDVLAAARAARAASARVGVDVSISATACNIGAGGVIDPPDGWIIVLADDFAVAALPAADAAAAIDTMLWCPACSWVAIPSIPHSCMRGDA